MLRWKPAQNARLLTCKPHLRHVTGEASRLREQMPAALPAPGCFATPCQSGYFLADFRLA
jgi:hypothetical protein